MHNMLQGKQYFKNRKQELSDIFILFYILLHRIDIA